jgi:RNA polymerase sigma factor (sigma-70 family)
MTTELNKVLTEKRALGIFLAKRYPKVWKEVIKDSIQESFIALWKLEQKNEIIQQADRMRWLAKVSGRYVNRERIRTSRFESISIADNAQHTYASIDPNQSYSDKDYIDALLVQLNPIDKEIITRHFDGYYLYEIAKSMGTSIECIKQRHSRALKKLRRKKIHLICS